VDSQTISNGWVVRHRDDRSIRLTDRGRRAVGGWFGAGAVAPSH